MVRHAKETSGQGTRVGGTKRSATYRGTKAYIRSGSVGELSTNVASEKGDAAQTSVRAGKWKRR